MKKKHNPLRGVIMCLFRGYGLRPNCEAIIDFNPFKPEFTIVIFIHYTTAVAILDL